jgi:hypothetical protein
MDTSLTLPELERRMTRLERVVESVDIDRERLTISMSELAASTEAALKMTEHQQKTQDKTLETLQKQTKYLIAVLSVIVLQGGPELIGKIAKLVVSMHTGVEL